MSKTIVVFGFGPGISRAVAEKFGAEGFQVALVARNAERLAEGVKALQAKGVKAAAYTCDVRDPAATRAVVARARKELGPITALQWNAYASSAGNVLEADAAALREVYDVAVTSLMAAVTEALPDLRQAKGAVLVTNGGLGLFDPNMDSMAAQYGSMGLAIGNAAKHKLVRMLALKLKPDGVHVGEVMVLGLVKGTAFDRGNATIDPTQIAKRFWEHFTERTETTVRVG
ncbi:MAG: SDR family NAD(P)-dependent oxidoreductase [Deltaproteobacteria bacterium]|nr:SDR family NAD(P)-dependent oxidoreductase [Deltaproteobacteria bacterium]